ncbi:uncharacterized protein LAESUDRAFT_622439, partial [Laetiporus sulphureus 93-53]
PLPDLPAHLLADSAIQMALKVCENHIQVDTPFNVDKLENMLFDHPNQPFVRSVIHGLHHGFWPPDNGEWEMELEEVINNHPADSPDIDAIWAFHDKEISAGQWSLKLPNLLPGMKISPMFIVWWDEKPHIITNHSAPGLNDSILDAEAKVHYDNMRDFRQEMR